jgi:hypothetical protein
VTVCHLPPSVGAGDLAALADGRTFRVVKAVDVGPGAAVDVLCAAEAARLVVIDSLP